MYSLLDVLMWFGLEFDIWYQTITKATQVAHSLSDNSKETTRNMKYIAGYTQPLNKWKRLVSDTRDCVRICTEQSWYVVTAMKKEFELESEIEKETQILQSWITISSGKSNQVRIAFPSQFWVSDGVILFHRNGMQKRKDVWTVLRH